MANIWSYLFINVEYSLSFCYLSIYRLANFLALLGVPMLPVLTDIVVAASSAVAAFAFTSFIHARRRAIDLKVLDTLPGTVYQRLLLTHVALTVGTTERRLSKR